MRRLTNIALRSWRFRPRNTIACVKIEREVFWIAVVWIKEVQILIHEISCGPSSAGHPDDNFEVAHAFIPRDSNSFAAVFVSEPL